jgi:hypothetical protein
VDQQEIARALGAAEVARGVAEQRRQRVRYQDDGVGRSDDPALERRQRAPARVEHEQMGREGELQRRQRQADRERQRRARRAEDGRQQVKEADRGHQRPYGSSGAQRPRREPAAQPRGTDRHGEPDADRGRGAEQRHLAGHRDSGHSRRTGAGGEGEQPAAPPDHRPPPAAIMASAADDTSPYGMNPAAVLPESRRPRSSGSRLDVSTTAGGAACCAS